MLSQEDCHRLALLEGQLRRDDPAFVDRMTAGPDDRDETPRRPVPLPLMLSTAMAWVAALSLVVIGWWVAAVVAALWAVVVGSALAYRCRPANRAPGPQLLPPAY